MIEKIPQLLLFGLPLAVAGQNIVATICLVVMSVAALRTPKLSRYATSVYYAGIALAIFLAWASLATMLAPDHGAQIAEYLIGYLPLLLLPLLAPLVIATSQNTLNKSTSMLFGVSVCWGIVSFSQGLYGWHLAGTTMEFGFKRAQGLYSHPLSFAYVLILVWPIVLTLWKNDRRSYLRTAAVVGILVSLWTSESRVAQVIALAQAIVIGAMLFDARAKKILIVAMVVVAGFTAFTDNSVRRKFLNTTSGPEDHHTQYADDRLAFWAANWELVKDRPVLGNGVHISESMLDIAYAKIGLAQFHKKYMSHNTYLQFWVETGAVGLLIVLFWLAICLWQVVQLRSIPLGAAWAGLLIGGFSQNVFQDSVVRYGIMLVLIYQSLALANLQTSK